MAKASFIGLGNMGTFMAHNLLNQGVDLAVFNRSKEKVLPLIDNGAKLLEHPRDAFKHASILFSMLANDEALEEITESLLDGIYPGCIHVSFSTVACKTSENLAKKHEEKGAHFIAAPVFGRPDAAEKKELLVCVAGNKKAKEKILTFLNMISKKVFDFGETPQSVNAIKIAGNFMIISTIEMLAEAFAFAQKNGIDPKAMHAFFSETLFTSPIFTNYGKIILDKNFTPGLKMPLGLKDLNLFLNEALALNLSTPLAEAVKKQLDLSLAKGREELDWSAISLLPLEGPVATEEVFH